jgi:hypothetical protein
VDAGLSTFAAPRLAPKMIDLKLIFYRVDMLRNIYLGKYNISKQLKFLILYSLKPDKCLQSYNQAFRNTKMSKVFPDP